MADVIDSLYSQKIRQMITFGRGLILVLVLTVICGQICYAKLSQIDQFPPSEEELKAVGSEITPQITRLRIPFIANQGQVDKEVVFYARTFGGTLFVTRKGEMIYDLSIIENRGNPNAAIVQFFLSF